jgi:hypothetical protein
MLPPQAIFRVILSVFPQSKAGPKLAFCSRSGKTSEGACNRVDLAG